MAGAEAGEQIQQLLTTLNGKHGILGCLLASPEGAVVSSSLPAETDTATLASLSATLFSNNDISIQRMNRGNLVQMTLLTDQGILHIYNIAGHFLLVLTAKGQRINLEGLIRSIEEHSKQLAGMLA